MQASATEIVHGSTLETVQDTSTPLEIEVITEYSAEQSAPEQREFVFSYTISLTNISDEPFILIRRHWVITDANGNIKEIEGQGVLGKTPCLDPQTSFEYTSGIILETPVGTMHGYYVLKTQNGELLTVSISPFLLAQPNVLQ